jgi:hypothetical protein
MAIAEGENLEVGPPRRLVQSFNALWSDDVKAARTSPGIMPESDPSEEV